MDVVFIGCVELSRRVLERVLEVDGVRVTGVVTREASSFNADFEPLAPVARREGLSTFIDEGNDQERMAAWLREREVDVGFCFGWSYLLGPEVLAAFSRGVVGYHPAPLPRGRGRHPIVWALALGLDRTASTLFLMDEGADTGPILDQEAVRIGEDDDARSLYDRLAETVQSQVTRTARALRCGEARPRPQEEERATYWRKRGYPDGQIDWRMSARSIYDLVRALTRPYVGAHCTVDGEDVKIWRAEFPQDLPPDLSYRVPGEVLAAGPHGVDVRCGEGAIRVVEHEFEALPEPGTFL